MALPTRHRSWQTDSHTTLTEWRHSRQPVKVEPRSVDAKTLEVDSVVDGEDACRRAKRHPCIRGYAARIGDHRGATARMYPQQPAHHRPRLHEVMNVPQHRHVPWPAQYPEEVHLEAVRMDEIGSRFSNRMLQVLRVEHHRRQRLDEP